MIVNQLGKLWTKLDRICERILKTKPSAEVGKEFFDAAFEELPILGFYTSQTTWQAGTIVCRWKQGI